MDNVTIPNIYDESRNVSIRLGETIARLREVADALAGSVPMTDSAGNVSPNRVGILGKIADVIDQQHLQLSELQYQLDRIERAAIPQEPVAKITHSGAVPAVRAERAY